MSSPLSQDLAAKIIEMLVQRGHVLLSKGGRPALVREVADRTNDTLATIIGRMPPPGVVDNEVTSTFGDESLDDTVEEMVEDVTASLMDSDHVEDVFSEDAVIRRDVFRVVKDTLLSSDRVWGEAEEADVEVNLESLGYIASKAAQRADLATVEGALGRAARASQAKLLRYSPETRTATFRAALASPDARLELEEAVADELGNLVDEGKVALPTIERRISLDRAVSAAERAAARPRIDVAASKTLLRSGCTATWEFTAPDAIAVALVPMSEQDGRAVDAHVEAFTREVQAILATPREAAATGLDAWQKLARSLDVKAKPEKKAAPEEEAPTTARAAREAAPASKRAAEAAPSSRKARAPEEEAAPSRKAKAAEEAAPPARKRKAKAAEEEAAPPARKRKAKAAEEEAAPPSRKAAPKKAAEAEPAPKKTGVKKAAARESRPGTKKTTEKKPAEKKAKPATRGGSLRKAASKAKDAGKKAAGSVRPAARSGRAAPKSARTAPKSTRPAPKSARSAPTSARTAPKSTRSAPRSARSAPKSARMAPKSTRSAPKSARTAPRSARTAPKSTRSAPRSARSAPKSARMAPKSTRSAPRSARSAPKSARTAPRSTRSAPRSARPAAKKATKKAARR